MMGNEKFSIPFLLRNYACALDLIFRAMVIIEFSGSEFCEIVLVQILVVHNIHFVSHSEKMSIYAIFMCVIKS